MEKENQVAAEMLMTQLSQKLSSYKRHSLPQEYMSMYGHDEYEVEFRSQFLFDLSTDLNQVATIILHLVDQEQDSEKVRQKFEKYKNISML